MNEEPVSLAQQVKDDLRLTLRTHMVRGGTGIPRRCLLTFK